MTTDWHEAPAPERSDGTREVGRRIDGVANVLKFRISTSAFIHPLALFGDGAVIWHHTVILEGVSIGDGTSIGSGTEVGRGSKVGKNCRIGAHVFLPPKSFIGDNVFIGPGTVFTDDKWPVAGNLNYVAQPPTVHHGASIGAGCVVLPGVTIGASSTVGAGTVVTRDVPANAVRRNVLESTS